jgi:hypothetical protein
MPRSPLRQVSLSFNPLFLYKHISLVLLCSYVSSSLHGGKSRENLILGHLVKKFVALFCAIAMCVTVLTRALH